MLPTPEQIHDLSTNEAGQVCGVRRKWRWLKEEAARIGAVPLAEQLCAQPALPEIVGGLALASEIQPMTRRDVSVLADALLRLVGDDRTFEWVWGEKGFQSKTFPVAQLAVEAIIALLQRHRTALRKLEPALDVEIDAGERLIACLDAALDNRAGKLAVRTTLRGFRQLIAHPDRRVDVGGAMAASLEAAATSVSRVADLRWMALEELALAARGPNRPREAFQEASERAIKLMAESLTDETTDVRFRRLAQRKLSSVAPTYVEQIQEEGKIPLIDLPDPQEVITAWGRPADRAVESLVSRVKTSTVSEALLADESGCARRRLAAACLAPAMTQRADWQEVCGWLLASAVQQGEVEIARAGVAQTSLTIDVGAFAAERMVKVLSRHVREQEAVLSVVIAALDPLLDAHEERSREFATVFGRVLAVIRNGGFEQEHRQEVVEVLQRCASDGGRPAAARFAALSALEEMRVQGTLVWELLVSDSEEPRLRALLGGRVHAWCPDEVLALVDDSTQPWTLLETASGSLPISQPRRMAPLPWLIASLDAAEDDGTINAVVRELGVRLNPREPGFSTVVSQLVSECTAEMAHKLRSVVASQADRGVPRWSASMVLSLLGEPEDEELLVSFAVERGAWTHMDPFTDDLAGRDLLEHMTLDPLSHENPRHMLEPYIFAGFGEAHAKRIMAKIFVVLGQAARRDGYLFKARHAYRRAHNLDPLNLDVRREIFDLPPR